MNVLTYFKYKIKFLTAKFKRIVMYFKIHFRHKKFKRIKSQKVMLVRLESAIKNNLTHLLPIQNWVGYRDIGKSTVMYYLAYKYKLPIMVDNLSMLKVHQIESAKMGFIGIDFYVLNKGFQNLKGKRFNKNIILVDLVGYSPSDSEVLNLAKELNLKLIGIVKDYPKNNVNNSEELVIALEMAKKIKMDKLIK